MKIHWTLISLCIGICSGVAVQLTFESWKIALPAGILSFLIALYFDPKRRYFRAFSMIIAIIAGLNKFFFEIKGTLFGIDFKVGSGEISWVVTFGLILLAGFCLFLDYFERNGKLKGTFLDFTINKNVVKNVKGENIQVHQNINKK
ncbi:hypothetical protein C8N46_104203 [Kordia periserrulae]|uniref:Uncharacterized protein n=1 Tax=Kordia periserrulae TaxID=701523 RepID=A0A2T6BZS0_9FLAO|nr:hypothetical protein [Kordia periserrulae]PTX61560.1 hypothetical protein C8N46_104203 [Kordia periserrulae]